MDVYKMKVILIALDKKHTKMGVDAELVEARVPILIPELSSRWRMLAENPTGVSFRTFIYSGELDGLPVYKEAEDRMSMTFWED